MSKTMHLYPRISEKAYAQSQTGTYVFVVPITANKVEIARAVSSQFDVTVTDVNCVVQKGKAVRFYRKGRFDKGERSDLKKAYVRLAEGQSIPVFAADEPEAPKAEKAKKDAKKGGKE